VAAQASKIMRLFAGTQFNRPLKCERCGALESECLCPRQPSPPKSGSQQIARLNKEKRPKGKIVTVIRGLADVGLNGLLSHLKAACGAGGTLKDGVLEIQGDHVDRIPPP
jgi:translation initiation factor 1